MELLAGLAGLAGLVAVGVAGYRWARVAQREHYIAGSCVRAAWRWAARRPPNAVLAVALLLGLAAVAVMGGTGATAALIALGTVAVAGGWPLGMALVGSPPLKLTRRASTTLGTAALVAAAAAGLVWAVADQLTAVVAAAAGMPLWVDLALLVARPLEATAAQRHRRRAETRLRRVAPTVIAVTGSWGKTSVKNHIRDLLAAGADVVASPASWNNLAGLSRTVNEHLSDSTEIVVAEMGMYGPGEIRSLCGWVRPHIAVICAVGPMHLERVGSLEGIAAAKAEIVEGCEKAVLWVEDPLLEDHAMRAMPEGAEVWRVGAAGGADMATGLGPSGGEWSDSEDGSADAAGSATEIDAGDGPVAGAHPDPRCDAGEGESGLDVAVGVAVAGDGGSSEIRVWHRGALIGACPAAPGLYASNVGCAVAACLAHGRPATEIAKRLPMLSVPKNRGGAEISESGVYVLDDTFNSNPQGAAAALRRLHHDVSGRKVLATPGMVELGRMQDDENAKLAAEASRLGIEVLAIGWTNRKALRQGTGDKALLAKNRAAAADWVRHNLSEGDGVAWENDLPDHYP